jgi:tripartite-type tricarboxylate transporter receptor subunit TctC
MRLALALFACLGMLGTVHAQGYPSKAVRVIVPFAPGGPADAVARAVSERLSAGLGQQFLVQNQPGAAGTIGTDALVKATPDGYTLLLANNAFVISEVAASKPLPYSPERDLAPVALLGTSPYVLVSAPSIPARNAAELIARLKEKPGAMYYTGGFPWSGAQAAGEIFLRATGTQAVHVPFKGTGPALEAVLAGQVLFGFFDVVAVLPYLREGKLRALAVTGPQRSASLPEVPTLREAGVPDAEFVQWYGLFAPSGTPRDVVERLRSALDQALKDPGLRERLSSLAIASGDTSPQSLRNVAEVQRRTLRRWNYCCGVP